MDQSSLLKLSICITTFNRGAFIGATLDSILCQLRENCEIVILDGASTDNTGEVLSSYAARSPQVRYIRQATNNGLDRDYDRVIELARGEYCWLMTDDDLLMPGAVDAVLSAIRQDLSLVIVNVEYRDFSMQNVVQQRWFDFESDRIYRPQEMDRLFEEIGGPLNANCFVVKRMVWLVRERERYIGSLLLYLGVIFQAHFSADVLIIAQPLVSYRRGNSHTWSAKVSEIVWEKWPSIVESIPIAESTKRKIYNMQPWRHIPEMLVWRGRGYYSMTDYRRWIRPRLRKYKERVAPALVALCPGTIINLLLILYYSWTRRSYGYTRWDLLLLELKESRFHPRNWRIFALRRDSVDLAE